MAIINISNSIKNATSLSEVMDLVNGATDGHVEGMEGLEFTPAQLAGQYAHSAAKAQDYMGEAEIEAHLEILAEEGATFDFSAALAHGLAIAAAEAGDAPALSNAIMDATSTGRVVEIINQASSERGHSELPDTQFTAEQLAGQYAWGAAADAKEITEDMMLQNLEFLGDEGAKFDRAQALAHAQALTTAYPAEEVDSAE